MNVLESIKRILGKSGVLEKQQYGERDNASRTELIKGLTNFMPEPTKKNNEKRCQFIMAGECIQGSTLGENIVLDMQNKLNGEPVIFDDIEIQILNYFFKESVSKETLKQISGNSLEDVVGIIKTEAIAEAAKKGYTQEMGKIFIKRGRSFEQVLQEAILKRNNEKEENTK